MGRSEMTDRRHPPEASNSAPGNPGAPANVVDLADWLEQLPHNGALEHLATLPVARRAETFGYLPLSVQVELAHRMARQDLAEIVTEMDADDRADLFNCLTEEEQQRLMHDLAQEECEDIRRLSAHAEGTVGAIMTTDYATLTTKMNARDAIAALRRCAPGKETIYRSYVLDEDRRLIGSVPLHELTLAADDELVGDIMDSTPISVSVNADQEDAARTIAHYKFLAMPVVDIQGKLVGIVTHDDAADAMQAETTEDFQKISTVLPFTQSLREVGIRVLYSKRIIWLSLLIFGNLFSGAGIAYFEETILAYVSLVFFLPLLIDSSGNAGSQSATLMVRALATGDVALKHWRGLILRELVVAVGLGATMALLVFPIGALRGGSAIAMVVGLTMFVLVIVGSLVGMSLPFLLSRLRLDPATASGPLVTSISDAVGVLVYFSIATLVLRL
ncbi:MAG TPA: magnesium transporter [Steroidobacteraceae bacterium]|nr:magnesium transporter [Steroidobacteraceae bacterium]